MEPRVLGYERSGARRRRRAVWLVIVVVVFTITALTVYHVVPTCKPRRTQSRSSVRLTTAWSLASQLTLYAEHHAGSLPESLERLEKDDRGVCYWYPGTFRRVPNPGGPYPLYAFPFHARPFLCEYRGAGVTTNSPGAVVFRWLDRANTLTFAINGEGQVRELSEPTPAPSSPAPAETAGADAGGL